MTRYQVAKVFVILETAITIPFSTYIGCAYGGGQVLLPSIFLALQTVLAVASLTVYLWILEQLNKR